MLRFLTALLLVCCAIPALAAQKLKNGAPFFVSQDADLPRNVLILTFLGGPAALPLEHQGVFTILSKSLREGPMDMAESEYKDQLFSLGTDIDFLVRQKVFEIVLRAPPANLEKALELLNRTLSKPRISKEFFERYKSDELAGKKARFENMQHVLFYFGLRDFFSHAPETLNGDTSPISLEKLTHEAFTAGLPKIFNNQRLFISYVGPEPASSVRKKVETALADRLKDKFLPWKPKTVDAPKLIGFKYTIINKPGATDNQIGFYFPQKIKRDSMEWTNATYVMDLLGGGLHGRLGHTLRTVRGLTYSASSMFSSSNLPLWIAYTFGGVEQTKPLLEGVPEVIQTFKKTALKPTDVSEAKLRLLNSYKTETELPQDSMRELAWYFSQGLNPEHAKRLEQDLQQATVAQVSKFKDRLNTNNGAVYLMGDKEVLLKALEGIGVKRDTVRIVEVNEIL